MEEDRCDMLRMAVAHRGQRLQRQRRALPRSTGTKSTMANTSISDAELRTALLSASARRSRLASVAPDVVRFLFDEGLIEVRLTEAGRWKLKELTDRERERVRRGRP